MGHHYCCKERKVKKGLWSPEEDEKLLRYITAYGHGCWRKVPEEAGLQRCGKSCRLRWLNYLRPDIKRGGFTPDEENLIIKLHEVVGNRWAHMAKCLPGRTDNEIKNYWNSWIKKKLERPSSPITTSADHFHQYSQMACLNPNNKDNFVIQTFIARPSAYPPFMFEETSPDEGTTAPKINISEQEDQHFPLNVNSNNLGAWILDQCNVEALPFISPFANMDANLLIPSLIGSTTDINADMIEAESCSNIEEEGHDISIGCLQRHQDSNAVVVHSRQQQPCSNFQYCWNSVEEHHGGDAIDVPSSSNKGANNYKMIESSLPSHIGELNDG